MRIWRSRPTTVALFVGLSLLLFSWVPGPPVVSEQFALPKDVVLGGLGLASAVLLVARQGLPWERAIDAPIVALLGWGVLLTVIAATNTDVAWRALGTFAAAFALFVLARSVSTESRAETLYSAICLVLGAVVVAVLLEAYGGIPFISEQGRAPGATLGNRNLVARLLCLSLPLFWRQLILADRPRTRRMLAAIIMLATVAVILSRSRGAWLVAGMIMIMIALPVVSLFISDSQLIPRTRACARLWAIAILVGAVLAVATPNRLGWTLRDFASSASRALDYQRGSGRGRVIQAETTLRMIRARPLEGVGPGNWWITYPAFGRLGDPSLEADALYAGPQVPRGDVLSLTAEFGIPGLLLFLVGATGLVMRAVSMLRIPDRVVQSSGVMILAICGATALLSFVDPVLRLSPTLGLIALLLGLGLGRAARAAPANTPPDQAAAPPLGVRCARRAVVAVCGVASLLPADGALRDLAVLPTITSANASLNDMYRAESIAPHNVEVRLLLSSLLIGTHRCDLAALHLAQASRLEPFSDVARRLRARCGKPAR
jgi:O-antigen ligase